MTIAFEAIKPAIGARAQVKDRAALFTAEGAAQVRAALNKHTVLVFPTLDLTDEEQLHFTDLIGPRSTFASKAPTGSADGDIYRVTLDKAVNARPEYILATFFWHMDGVTVDMPPPAASLLSARSVASQGGQTQFASTYAAYAALPEAEKRALDGVRVRHTTWSGMRPFHDLLTEDERRHFLETGTIAQEHPIVWTHADGRQSLVIGSTAGSIVDMPVPHGRALIQRLLEWAAQPDFTYSHDWRAGDFVMWDNTGTLHRVVPYDEASGRMMHRTSIAGAESVA